SRRHPRPPAERRHRTARLLRRNDVGQTLTPRATKSSLDDLLAGASSREAWKTSESLSGSAIERVEIGGERFVVKHLHVDDDWIQRAQGDLFTKPLQMWRTGMFDALPASL